MQSRHELMRGDYVAPRRPGERVEEKKSILRKASSLTTFVQTLLEPEVGAVHLQMPPSPLARVFAIVTKKRTPLFINNTPPEVRDYSLDQDLQQARLNMHAKLGYPEHPFALQTLNAVEKEVKKVAAAFDAQGYALHCFDLRSTYEPENRAWQEWHPDGGTMDVRCLIPFWGKPTEYKGVGKDFTFSERTMTAHKAGPEGPLHRGPEPVAGTSRLIGVLDFVKR